MNKKGILISSIVAAASIGAVAWKWWDYKSKCTHNFNDDNYIDDDFDFEDDEDNDEYDHKSFENTIERECQLYAIGADLGFIQGIQNGKKATELLPKYLRQNFKSLAYFEDSKYQNQQNQMEFNDSDEESKFLKGYRSGFGDGFIMEFCDSLEELIQNENG